MPIYQYSCDEHGMFEVFQGMKEKHNKAECPYCGDYGIRVYNAPNLQTDTNFMMTGVYDNRLGSRVEGRKDWKRKIEAKGLMELDKSELRDTKPYTAEDRIKKAGLGVGSVDIRECLR